MLRPDDGITGIDLDDCISDSGGYTPLAAEVLGYGETYAEVSPSGEGVRLFAAGKIERSKIVAGVELYVGGRYLTITGNQVEGVPSDIRPAPRTIARLMEAVAPSRPTASPAATRPTGGGEDLERIRDALRHLPSDNYAQWIGIGMALKDELGDAGFALWHDWSLRSLNYKEGLTQEKWRSFNGSGIAIGTLFHRAGEHGWVDPRSDAAREAKGAELRARLMAGKVVDQQLVEPARQAQEQREQAKVAQRKQAPTWITARDLCAMKFPPIRYVVPGYVAEGLTLIAGKPKLGKSWLCMDLALAVAEGSTCLGGIACERGDVLYLALEDNRRRLQSRIAKVRQAESLCGVAVTDRLHLATEWPRAGAGGVQALREWIKDHPEARLVIVDVLAMFKAIAKDKDRSLYEADYLAIKELQVMAMETGVAVVVVHHTRKAEAEDPFDTVSGTLGLSGAADTTLVLNRTSAGCTLYGRGRDIEEIETAVQFDKITCRWRALGNAAEVQRSDERGRILAVVADAAEPVTPSDIATAAGMKCGNVRRLLVKMAKDGEVLKSGRGRYVHPDRSDLLPPGNSGNKVTSYADKDDLPEWDE